MLTNDGEREDDFLKGPGNIVLVRSLVPERTGEALNDGGTTDLEAVAFFSTWPKDIIRALTLA